MASVQFYALDEMSIKKYSYAVFTILERTINHLQVSATPHFVVCVRGEVRTRAPLPRRAEIYRHVITFFSLVLVFPPVVQKVNE